MKGMSCHSVSDLLQQHNMEGVLTGDLIFNGINYFLPVMVNKQGGTVNKLAFTVDTGASYSYAI
jgi:hypothetical protein